MAKGNWPVLRHYDEDHLARIALPLGGIGTGTVSLGGYGDLRDWEVMNRPAKGFTPRGYRRCGPFFALRLRAAGGEPMARALEGPLPLDAYEGDSGSPAANHGLPRFRKCSFDAAYPLGQVRLSDPSVPADVRLEAFNPFIPADAERSGLPVAALRYVLTNRSSKAMSATVCGTVPNFIGHDGKEGRCQGNRNLQRQGATCRGVLMGTTGTPDTPGTAERGAQWGTLALATVTKGKVSTRTSWMKAGWGTSLLEFWDDLLTDGHLEDHPSEDDEMPMASVAVEVRLPARATREVTFLLGWHFPNRYTWSPCGPEACDCDREADRIGNYYTTQYADAWDVVEKVAPQLKVLERDTVEFVEAFCSSDLPEVVKEAALFNLSTLRTQTCFRTPDGRFYGWEGCGDHEGCCNGTCTHVWNYEQATAFLFGDLARQMREVEFLHATDDEGLMSFRTHLPLERAQNSGKAAADGQMGCIAKVYRDWQLSGDGDWLRRMWPAVKRALEFCWIPGGWDANRDGVMEGCQHNTMDVEYYGPNPQMGAWYLCALRAAEEMAEYVGEELFALECRRLFEQGSRWLDDHLFNGEYYEHMVQAPARPEDVAEGLRLGAGAADVTKPDYQLAEGCLVDQLIGQVMAHVCGLGYLLRRTNVKKTHRSIYRHNMRRGLHGHFNILRSYALGDESALLMASYPKGRPANPFPYFTEVMTGFEYTAAIGMLYEGLLSNGLQCMQNTRDRYDGHKRSPFDEAECGHHYARAMITWAAHLALSGFRYSAVTETLAFGEANSRWFWSTGTAWGTCRITGGQTRKEVELKSLRGELSFSRLVLTGYGAVEPPKPVRIGKGKTRKLAVTPE